MQNQITEILAFLKIVVLMCRAPLMTIRLRNIPLMELLLALSKIVANMEFLGRRTSIYEGKHEKHRYYSINEHERFSFCARLETHW